MLFSLFFNLFDYIRLWLFFSLAVIAKSVEEGLVRFLLFAVSSVYQLGGYCMRLKVLFFPANILHRISDVV